MEFQYFLLLNGYYNMSLHSPQPLLILDQQQTSLVCRHLMSQILSTLQNFFCPLLIILRCSFFAKCQHLSFNTPCALRCMLFSKNLISSFLFLKSVSFLSEKQRLIFSMPQTIPHSKKFESLSLQEQSEPLLLLPSSLLCRGEGGGENIKCNVLLLLSLPV